MVIYNYIFYYTYKFYSKQNNNIYIRILLYIVNKKLKFL